MRPLPLPFILLTMLLIASCSPQTVTADIIDPRCDGPEGAASQECITGFVTDGESGDSSGGSGGADDSSTGGGGSGGDADGGTGGSGETCSNPDVTINRLGQELVVTLGCALAYPQGQHAPAVTPVEAARSAISRLELHAIQIGMAPEVDPELGHRHSYVNVPIWMWVHEPDERSWGPTSTSVSLQGYTITMTAHVDRVEWDMGDGAVISCRQGTPFHTSMGFVPSPDCGHLYKYTSKRQPDRLYTVTATSHWSVEWTASTGQSGIIEVTTASETQLEIGELRAVNVSNPPNPPSPPDE